MAYTTIDDPSAYFTTLLYTGNGASSRDLTFSANAGDFKPDWLWFKQRSQSARQHNVYDSSRGNSERLEPDNTGAEETQTGLHKTFNTNGFTIGAGNIVNENSQTFVTWAWKANGGTTSSNSSGDITTTVQANTTAGFSIFTYTGTGTAGDTIGHGLGAVPSLFIIKRRSGTEDWVVYHHKNTSAPETDHLLLNTTDATADSDTRFNDTAPTSTLITLGNNAVVNASSSTYVGYAFAEKQGYSKFGSYTGNGNADGAFVYTGFKPAWLMIKRTSGTENWVLWDNKRDPFNNFYHVLLPNATSAEDTTNAGSGGRYVGDFLSNGFKLRNTHDTSNSSSNYIYMAFAESPFVSSKGVPTTAR
jgi:hypothetical protein